jgi:hypothetical protein
VAEGARLESVYTGNRIVGSNPTPSARTLIRSHSPTYASVREVPEKYCYSTLKPVFTRSLSFAIVGEMIMGTVAGLELTWHGQRAG